MTHERCAPECLELRLIEATEAAPDRVECAHCGNIETLADWSARIEIKPVESTNIAGVGYHEGLRILRVNFKNGGRYAFLAVPATVALALREAEHPGTFFSQTVRAKFAGIKLAAPKAEDAG